MKVKFRTNLDHYKKACFPTTLTMPPRIGEKVLVGSTMTSFYKDKKLPCRLEVVDVIWGEDDVVCELWYNEIDKQIASCCGANLF